MRVDNANEAWQETWIELTEDAEAMGVESRAGGTRESIGHEFEIADPRKNVVTEPARLFCPWYAAAETLWYLSGERSVDRVKAYAPRYERFAEADGLAHGAYGYRWADGSRDFVAEADAHGEGQVCNTQLATCLAHLIDKPNTRQAVMTCWHAGDIVHALLGDKKDLPCTLSLQWLRRGGFLNLVVTMRSNDVWLGLPNDIYAFTTLQRLFADALGDKLGGYFHRAGSMHVYNRDIFTITEYQPYEGAPADYELVTDRCGKVSEAIKCAVELETEMREGSATFDSIKAALGRTVLADLVTACAIRWDRATPDDLVCPALRATAIRRLAHDRG